MSIELITRTCWSRDLQASTWKRLIRERIGGFEGQDGADELCSALFGLILSTPTPPVLLISYLHAAVSAQPLITPSTYLRHFTELPLTSPPSTISLLSSYAQPSALHALLSNSPSGQLLHIAAILALLLRASPVTTPLGNVAAALPASLNLDGLDTAGEEAREIRRLVKEALASPAVEQREDLKVNLGLLATIFAEPFTPVDPTPPPGFPSEPPAETEQAPPPRELHDAEVQLLIRQLVQDRATPLGGGCTPAAVARLRAALDGWAHAPAAAFSETILRAALGVLSSLKQPEALDPIKMRRSEREWLVWRSFIGQRVAGLLAAIPELHPDQHHTALSALLSEAELASQLDSSPTIAMLSSDPASSAETLSFPSLRSAVLRSFRSADLLPIDAELEGGAGAADAIEELAQAAGSSPQAYIEAQLSLDSAPEDVQLFLDRLLPSIASHPAFSSVLFKRIESLASSHDLDPLAHIASALTARPAALDIALLYAEATPFLDALHAFVQSFNLSDHHGDAQSGYSQFGTVTLFHQLVLQRYQLKHHLADTRFYSASSLAHTLSELFPADRELVGTWVTALFGSEGISDEALRTTKPADLLRLAPTLFAQSILACSMRHIDMDTMQGGLSYFNQDLLSWTLTGVIEWLCAEIPRQGLFATVHLETLQSLILPTSCPPAVLELVRGSLFRLLSDRALGIVIQGTAFDAQGVRKALEERSVGGGGANGEASLPSAAEQRSASWEETMRTTVELALASPMPQHLNRLLSIRPALSALGPRALSSYLASLPPHAAPLLSALLASPSTLPYAPISTLLEHFLRSTIAETLLQPAAHGTSTETLRRVAVGALGMAERWERRLSGADEGRTVKERAREVLSRLEDVEAVRIGKKRARGKKRIGEQFVEALRKEGGELFAVVAS